MGMGTWNAVVVGAGPAGASAAYFLARSGVRVLLADRASFPRDKVCGDACTPRACAVLREMEVLPEIANGRKPIETIRMMSPAGREVALSWASDRYGDRGYVVAREELDHLLLQAAEKAGAEFRPNLAVKSVEVESSGVSINWSNGSAPTQAQVVIGADGAYSRVRRSLGGDSYPRDFSAWAMRAYFEDVEVEDVHSIYVSWERPLLPGYAWLFPLGEGRVNLGLGMRGSTLRRRGRKLRRYFDAFLEGTSHFASIVRRGRPSGRAKGHSLPFGMRPRILAAPRVMLAGDAAGLINPFSGEGIEGALESGQLAADSAVGCLERGDFSPRAARRYSRQLRERFRRNYYLNDTFGRFMKYPWLVERVMQAADRDPRSEKELVELILYGGQKVPWRAIRHVATPGRLQSTSRASS